MGDIHYVVYMYIQVSVYRDYMLSIAFILNIRLNLYEIYISRVNDDKKAMYWIFMKFLR